MKAKLNQTLKTSDLLSLLALLGIVAGISTMIVSRAMKDTDRSLALSEAQNLAFQLVNGGFASPTESSRGPASVAETPSDGEVGVFRGQGGIGKDPWGKSFQYSVVRNSQNKVTHVVVWSLGPNAKADTTEVAIQRAVDQKEKIFQGDDFGFIQAVTRLPHSETFTQ